MLHDSFRTHTMDVERITRTSDGAGGWIRTMGPAGEVVGSLQPLGAAEVVVAEAEQAQARWVFFCDEDEDVLRDDELINADRRFRVISTGKWHAGSPIDHLRVDLEEIQRGR